MCLIVMAYRTNPRFPLIVAANRDEFYARPSAPAHFWPEFPGVFAGRDLEQGGTWLGMTAVGRFAALTNYRDPARVRPDAISRGRLVTDFLTGGDAPGAYVRAAAAAAGSYNPFNLLAGDPESLWYCSGVTGEVQVLAPGIYGLSNSLLNTPWPKVVKVRAGMARLAAGEPSPEDLFALMGDARQADDEQLPATGVSLDWERTLSPVFISAEGYGTRSSTVLTVEAAGRVRFIERTFQPDKAKWSQVESVFRLSAAPGAAP